MKTVTLSPGQTQIYNTQLKTTVTCPQPHDLPLSPSLSVTGSPHLHLGLWPVFATENTKLNPRFSLTPLKGHLLPAEAQQDVTHASVQREESTPWSPESGGGVWRIKRLWTSCHRDGLALLNPNPLDTSGSEFPPSVLQNWCPTGTQSRGGTRIPPVLMTWVVLCCWPGWVMHLPPGPVTLTS